MQYVFATWSKHREQASALKQTGAGYLLLSFAEVGDFRPDELAEYKSRFSLPKCSQATPPSQSASLPKLLIDSGAYTVRKGGEIDLDAYATFLTNNHDHIDHCINLDLIPRRPLTSVEQIDKASSESYENLGKLKRKGHSPIPVFHQFDHRDCLLRMLADGETYIALSPDKSQSIKMQTEWLDWVFPGLTYDDGELAVKVHGLGVSSHSLLTRYPWTSCDGSSWAQHAGRGGIIVPAYTDNEPDYSLPPFKLTVSNKNWRSWKEWPVPREQVEHFLREHCDTDIDAVRADTSARYVVNAIFYRNLEAAINSRGGDA